MSELLGNNITPSITKVAKSFNSLQQKEVVKGIKTASLLNGQIIEAIKDQEELAKNPVIKESYIPTGDEIRRDREEGEYR